MLVTPAPTRHAATVGWVGLSADGGRVAVRTDRGLFWADRGGAWNQVAHRRFVLACALSPCGRLLAWATLSEDVAVSVLDAGETVELLPQWAHPAGCVTEFPSDPDELRFSPDGSELWATYELRARWAVGSWTPLPPAGPPRPVPFPEDHGPDALGSPDGRRVALALPDGRDTRLLLAGPGGSAEVRLSGRFRTYGGRAAFSPGSTRLALAAGAAVHLFDPATGGALGRTPHARGPHVRGVAFAPDGALVATAGDRVRSFDLGTLRERPAFAPDAGSLTAVAVSADGLLAAAGTRTGRVVIWDA